LIGEVQAISPNSTNESQPVMAKSICECKHQYPKLQQGIIELDKFDPSITHRIVIASVEVNIKSRNTRDMNSNRVIIHLLRHNFLPNDHRARC
jgi:hypothetical protein